MTDQTTEQTATAATETAFDPSAYEGAVLSAEQVANGFPAEHLQAIKFATDKSLPVYQNFVLFGADGETEDLPEGYDVVVELFTTGRGEEKSVSGLLLVSVPTLETTQASTDGENFIRDKVRRAHLGKINAAIRTAKGVPTFPRTVSAFTAQRRSSEAMKVANEICGQMARELKRRGVGIDKGVLEIAWRSKSAAESMFSAKIAQVIETSLEKCIEGARKENKDVSQLLAWQATRASSDMFTSDEDVDLSGLFGDDNNSGDDDNSDE